MKKYLNIIFASCLSFIIGGCAKDGYVANVTDIRLVSVSPANVYPGNLVTILGRNFSDKASENTVTIGGIEALVIEASRHKLDVVVPENVPGVYAISVTSPSGSIEGLEINYLKIPDHEYLVTTVVGQKGVRKTVDGVGTAATVYLPTGLSKAPDGSIWFTDRGTGFTANKIRRIAQDLTVTTIADPSASGSAIWQGCFAEDGSFYFVDKALGSFYKLGTDYRITILATGMKSPMNVATDNEGNFYIPARDEGKIYKFDSNMNRSVFAEIPECPNYIKFDPCGNLVSTTQKGYKIVSISPEGSIRTIAGDGVQSPAATDGLDGDPLTATLGECRGLDFDSSGTMYFCDIKYHRLRKLTHDGSGDYSKGILETIAGDGAGYADGKGLNTKFNEPDDILVYDDNTIYIADAQNAVIRKIVIK